VGYATPIHEFNFGDHIEIETVRLNHGTPTSHIIIDGIPVSRFTVQDTGSGRNHPHRTRYWIDV